MAARTVARQAFRRYWTAERLRAWLDYNPETGKWMTKPRPIGTVNYFGKTRMPAETITLQGPDGKWRTEYAHLLAYLWMTGEWPPDEIDHWNNDSTDNRWSNLRPATRSQQNMNRRPKRPGSTGASFHKPSGRWQAYIKIDGKQIALGYFATAEEAHEAYKKAAVTMHGEFAHSSLVSEPSNNSSSTRLRANEIKSSKT